MGNRGPRLSAAEIGLLGLLGAWALFPLVLFLVYAGQEHASFSGADGLIGAGGILGADQLQYLAWIRDAGAHGLASDLFSLAPSGHVYLEPLFTISGWFWQAGVSVSVAYLIWKPVAVIALWLAGVAWARRAFPERLGPRTATVILAIFLYTPLAALVSWTSVGGTPFRFQLYLLGEELLGAGKLWGYVPSAFGLAFVVVTLLRAERALDPFQGESPAHRALALRVQRGPLVAATVTALLAAWLHPWQGITLILICLCVGVLQRRQGGLTLLLPAAGAAAPLVYYYLLGHSDPAWQLAAHYEVIPRLSPLVLLAGFGPLVAIGAFGVRRPEGSVFEQILLAWTGACFLTYFVNNAFAPHALQGLSFPLAVFVVRGWQRLRLPAVLAGIALVLVTVPGLAYDARKIVRTARGRHVQYYLPAADTRALDWVTAHGPRGAILAPTPFAATVPGLTGRAVWVGNGYWSPNYRPRAREADALFGGRLRSVAARVFVRDTGASLLVSDCTHRHNLTRALSALIGSVHTFGCARVYVLAAGRSLRR
jgi:hypothetical protein